ncbi:MAG: aldehyde ferredoxin oxidoreductase [Promethearchaeota archaeon]|nr:MAG: aldehyde ferredoxin oxidoreductase [Candidatus Lokiarchaeota archaeon]
MGKNSKEIFGYHGKILKIDLLKRKISEEPINVNYSQDFLGGAGYACRSLIEELTIDTSPLSPKNILMVMTGPFCLSGIPGSGRFVVCSKSPYTGLWGESNCGGNFGAEIKKAGYDGIFISGKSDTPIFLNIENQKANFHDADSLWSLSTKETSRVLKERFNSSKVLTIGQAGENLVKFSSINAEGKTAGRTGMGAVMGSKFLKAILIRGENHKIRIAEPTSFRESLKKTLKYILNQQRTEILRAYGTSAGVMTAHSLGDLPIKYWTLGKWNKNSVYNISGEKLNEKLMKSISCYNCPIGCTRAIELDKNGDKIVSEGPEYETIAGFGSLILNDDIESIKLANFLCNEFGLDTISTSSVIGLLFRLYNEDYINSEDIDGLNLEWGNSDAMLELIKKIAYRKGIGKLLAEGSEKVISHFGLDKNLSATINNLEVPYHDIRSCYGMALTYAFSPRGPCHTSADGYKVLRKTNKIDFTEIGVEKVDVHSNSEKLVKSSIKLQDYRAIYSSIILCVFTNPPPKYVLDLYNSMMGLSLSLNQFMKIGERIFNLKRLFNNKMGLTNKNDRIPKILLSPTENGTIKGKTPNFKKLKKYYYKFRNWDPNTGVPNNKKLKDLGLENLLDLKK